MKKKAIGAWALMIGLGIIAAVAGKKLYEKVKKPQPKPADADAWRKLREG